MLAVVLLVGLGAGAVFAAAAGARRTDTAAARLYKRGDVADLEMDPTSSALGAPRVDIARVQRIPQVRRATLVSFFALARRHGQTQPQQLDVFLAANADGSFIYDFDRIGRMPSFRGRLPDPRRADEVVPTTEEARLLHVTIGDSLPVGVAKFDGPQATAPSGFTPITLHVVGIATTPVGVLRGGSAQTFMFGTPAFARRFAASTVGSTVYVQLRDPSGLLTFERRAARALPKITFSVKTASQELSTFQRVASPYTNTLWLFALVAGIATMLIVAQAVVRMIRTDAAAVPELRALGFTSTQRATIAAARATLAVVLGVALAVVIAILASPLFPLGLVRGVEPYPGMHVDILALGVGALVVLAGLGIVIASVARRAARALAVDEVDRPGRASRVASALGRANAPVSIVFGTRLAFRHGRRTGSASTAASIFGLVAAIAATSAALVFGANLSELTTPRRYGQTWDTEVAYSGTSTLSLSDAQRALRDHSLAAGVTVATIGDVKLDDRVVSSYGFQALRGHALPVATDGRLPIRTDEIAVGARTLRQLHHSVGDTVSATADDGSHVRLHIVGETLLPSLNSNDPSLGADDGVAFTRQGLDRLNPDLRDEIDFALVDLAPGASLRQLRAHFDTQDFTVTGATPPGRHRQLRRRALDAAGPRRAPHRVGRRCARASLGHIGPGQPSRSGHPQDPRLHPRSGAADRGVAGARARRRGVDRRTRRRCRGRPRRLDPVRERTRAGVDGRHPDRPDRRRRRGGPRQRRTHRLASRPGRGADPSRVRVANGVGGPILSSP